MESVNRILTRSKRPPLVPKHFASPVSFFRCFFLAHVRLAVRLFSVTMSSFPFLQVLVFDCFFFKNMQIQMMLSPLNLTVTYLTFNTVVQACLTIPSSRIDWRPTSPHFCCCMRPPSLSLSLSLSPPTPFLSLPSVPFSTNVFSRRLVDAWLKCCVLCFLTIALF